jgi:hypothetical protein
MGQPEDNRRALVIDGTKISGELGNHVVAQRGQAAVRLQGQQERRSRFAGLTHCIGGVLPGLVVVGNVGELHHHRRVMAQVSAVLTQRFGVPVQIYAHEHAVVRHN